MDQKTQDKKINSFGELKPFTGKTKNYERPKNYEKMYDETLWRRVRFIEFHSKFTKQDPLS